MPMPQPAAKPGMPQGQPPVGSSPATSPVPNKGLEAAGLAKISLVVRQLEQIVPLIGAGTEAGQAVLKALTSLSKHAAGAASPGVEQSAMQNLMMKMRQQAPQIAQMRAGGGGGGGQPPGSPAAPPAPPAAAA